jgi:hypothetical protein
MAVSNKISLFDINETFGIDAAGSRVFSKFSANYVYNYYVQDELVTISSESRLQGPQGQQYNIDPDLPSSSQNSRPPAFITNDSGNTSLNPKNRPRYFELTLQGIPGADRIIELKSKDDRIGENPVLSLRSNNNSYNLAASISPDDVQQKRETILSRFGNQPINFEESLSVGLVDYNQIIDIQPIDRFLPNTPSAVSSRALATANMSSALFDRLKSTETSPVSIGVSTRQEATANALQINSLSADPSVSSGIVRALGGTNSRVPKEIIESVFTGPKLDSVNDGITEIVTRNESIELSGFINNESSIVSHRSGLANDAGLSTYAAMCIGYLIERTDLGPIVNSPLQAQNQTPNSTSEGSVSRLPLVTASTASKAVLDTGVLHNRKYRYTVRVVYYIESSTDARNPNVYGYFVASQPIDSLNGGLSIADIKTQVFPPSTIDFFRRGNTLHVNCDYPVTDHHVPITKFLLFSRKSVDAPFTLIGANSSFSPVAANFTQANKSLRRFRNEKVSNLSNVTHFMIEDYNFQSGDIITAVCVDAHGNMSNYGAQFHVRETRANSKKLQIDCVSGPRAPLGFPNLFLKLGFGGFSTGKSNATDIVNSAITTSGIKSFDIIPTYGLTSQYETIRLIGGPTGVNPLDIQGSAITKVGNQNILPERLRSLNAPNRAIINVLSVTQEKVANIDLRFRDLSTAPG